MKICHVFPFFSIRFAGGTSEFMYKICRGQTNAGHQNIIYSGNYKFDWALAGTLTGIQFRVTQSYLNQAGFSIMPGLKNITDMDFPDLDIVHFHVFRTYQNYILWKACKKHNVPFIIDAHGAIPYYKRKRLIKRLFDKLWGRKIIDDAAFLVTESKVGIDEYKKIFPDLNDEKFKIILPSFDMSEFYDLPNKGLFRIIHKIGENENIILFVGRLCKIKGLEFMIEGFAELIKIINNCRLVVVGDDSGDGYRESLVLKARKFNIEEKILFTGFLYGEDKLSALVDADIVVQLSQREQGPRVPFEAVLCETPVIVTQHTGSGEAVKGFSAGLTIPYGDTKKFVYAVKRILYNRKKYKIRTIAAKQKIINEMSIEAAVVKYMKLYSQVRR